MTQRILFFGMEGVFSRAPLNELIHSSHPICAIIVPRPDQSQRASEPIRLLAPPHAPESDVPLLNEPRDLNVIGMAWNSGIDVYEVSTLRDARVLAAINQLRPDLIVVACFNLLLPKSLITNYQSLNLHPSLLPEYRGPSPLFWIFHDGLEHAGVTVHLMDEHADTGDIVAQERVQLPDGIRYGNADKFLSEHAARLLLSALDTAPNSQFARTPQAPTTGLRAPNPTERDFVIAPDWTARRAFNFIHGIAEWNYPILFPLKAKRLVVRDAISFDAAEEMREPFVRTNNRWKIQCARGTITVIVSEEGP